VNGSRLAHADWRWRRAIRRRGDRMTRGPSQSAPAAARPAPATTRLSSISRRTALQAAGGRSHPPRRAAALNWSDEGLRCASRRRSRRCACCRAPAAIGACSVSAGSPRAACPAGAKAGSGTAGPHRWTTGKDASGLAGPETAPEIWGRAGVLCCRSEWFPVCRSSSRLPVEAGHTRATVPRSLLISAVASFVASNWVLRCPVLNTVNSSTCTDGLREDGECGVRRSRNA
jgi:hypothetical protein